MRTNGSLTEEKDKSGSAKVINLSMQKKYLLILNRIQVGFNSEKIFAAKPPSN